MRLKTTNKADFDTALLSALNSLGDITYPESFEVPESGNICLVAVNTDEEGNQSKTKINLDLVNVQPKSRNEAGEFIVTETDEEGNPTAYQMEVGYFVNIACNVALSFDEALIVTPEKPQYKFL